MSTTLGFALAAGTLAALNPCGFAMLPAYLTLFVTGTDPTARHRQQALMRALLATVAMTLGFVAVFATFGLLLTPIASTVQRWLPVATVVIGIALLVMGVAMLLGRAMALSLPKLAASSHPARSFGSMIGYGVAYAIASLGCTIGPFLAVTATTFRAGNAVTGIAAYGAYALGMGLVVGLLAVTVALTQQSTARFLRRAQRHLDRVGGALLVVVGAYVAWYGGYELRLGNGASAEDPVVGAATALQGRVAGWVDAVGPTTLAVVALVVVVAGVLARRWTSRSAANRARDLTERPAQAGR